MRFVLFVFLLVTTAHAEPLDSDARCGFRMIDTNGSLTLQGLAIGPSWTQGHYQLRISVIHSGGRSVSQQSGAFTSNGTQTHDLVASSTHFLAPGGRLEATLWLTDGDQTATCSIDRQN